MVMSYYANKEDAGILCVVCRGNIIKETEMRYDPSTGPLVIGPGSQGQYKMSWQYYCQQCGLSYAFLPKNQKAPS